MYSGAILVASSSIGKVSSPVSRMSQNLIYSSRIEEFRPPEVASSCWTQLD